MGQIELVRDFSLDRSQESEKDIVVKELFKGSNRRLVEVQLRNGAVLSRHNADVPITVQCISGTGTFSAGSELRESVTLHAGKLITLEAGIEHEVTAEPQLHILVSKFTGS
jgi:quercetin dioxygenase-like cupin family protein